MKIDAKLYNTVLKHAGATEDFDAFLKAHGLTPEDTADVKIAGSTMYVRQFLRRDGQFYFDEKTGDVAERTFPVTLKSSIPESVQTALASVSDEESEG